MAAGSSTKVDVHWKSIQVKTWACDVLCCRLKRLLVYSWMQVHNYTGECSSSSEPSVFKWLRTSEDGGSESRHQEGESQIPWKCNPLAWDRAVCAPALRCQASWWDWSQDLLPPTFYLQELCQALRQQESLQTSWQSQHQSLTTVMSELPAAQKVWSLVSHKTQTTNSLGPRLVQHIQLHFLPMKC